jgi:hypothetical protein
VYRVDPANDKTLLATASTAAITDDVHTFTYASTSQGRNRPKEVSQEEFNSQLVKEIKLQVLLGIIDKFEVSFLCPVG